MQNHRLPEEYVHSLLYRAAWTELGLSYSQPLRRAVVAFTDSQHTTELLDIHVPGEVAFRQGLPDDMAVQTFRIALTDKFIVFLCARFQYDISANDWNINTGYFGNLTKTVDFDISPVTTTDEHKALFDSLFGKHD